MKLVINKNEINMTPEQFMRKAGYGYIRDRQTGHDSFVYRLGRNFYPRFHMYINARDNNIIEFNLHLDQKQPSYAGAHMHNAEYDGEVVEREIERLKELITHNKGHITRNKDDVKGVESVIGHGRVEDQRHGFKEKKSWWKLW